MAPYTIRVVGDPVLRQLTNEIPSEEILEIDGTLAQLAQDMLTTMYEAPGVGLAAPQIGVRKRMFVYDVGEGPRVVINPVITETQGEWTYEEGCLSVPEMSWPIVRAKRVHLVGRDLDGNEVAIEADELEARCLQHEVDHLDGVLLIERLDPETRKQALRSIRERAMTPPGTAPGRGPDGTQRRETTTGGLSL
jgi:peptide deformylase